MTRKTLGDQNKQARANAVTVLAGMKGKNIKQLKDNEIKDVLLALLQLLGLADLDGNIK